MIFVTGDVHDMDMGGADQDWLRRNSELTEMECAVKYGEIAARSGVPVTLFLTGKAARQENETLTSLLENEFVEVGGHTWNALRPSWIHHLWKRLWGTFYGPAWFQRRDIARTLHVLEDAKRGKVEVWRTHGYRGTDKTEELLSRAGVRVVSDAIGPSEKARALSDELLSVPINVPPDHEHLYHGNYDISGEGANGGMKKIIREALGAEGRKRAFCDRRLMGKDWWEWVRDELEKRLKEFGFATLLLHPACMEILDGMELLEEIFDFLGERDCAFLSEAKNRACKT